MLVRSPCWGKPGQPQKFLFEILVPGYLNGGRLVCKADSMESLCNVFDYPTLPFSKRPSQDEQSLKVPSPKNNSGFPAPLLMLGVGEEKSDPPKWGLEREREVFKPSSCQPWRMGALPLMLKCSCTLGSQAAPPGTGSPRQELCWRQWQWGHGLFLGKVRHFLNSPNMCIFIFLWVRDRGRTGQDSSQFSLCIPFVLYS